MSARLRVSLSLIGLTALPAAACADGLVLPGFGRSEPYPRPGYRETAYPPPQVGVFGQRLPPTGVLPRPGYRQVRNQFPPPGGRYGGGFIEYVLTGGRPEPVAPQYANGAVPSVLSPGYALTHTPLSSAAPAYAAPTYAPAAARAALPQGGLPDYSALPPSYQPMAYAATAHLPRSGLPEYSPDQPAAGYGGALGPQSMALPGLPGLPGTAQLASIEGAPSIDPVFLRQDVAYAGRERAGTIVIDTPNKFLYLVEPQGHALRYGIGVGRPGFAWAGIKQITRKAEWPAWTPPREMLARRPDLPRYMAGGQANPLGARALYLGSSLYRIHGTNEPYTIGTNVSSGCIRMMNQDVIDLYGRVGVGTRVVVL